MLIEAGLSYRETMEVILEQTRGKREKKIVQSISRHLNEGRSLSESISHFDKAFKEFEVQSLRMGELSGQIALVLKSLASYHQRNTRIKRKLIQAFSYPVTVVIVAIGVLSFMLAFVVPMFQEIFDRFDAKLPALTEMILKLSGFMQENWAYIAIALAAISIAIYRVRKREDVRMNVSKAILAIPILGGTVITLQLSRMCLSLSMLLKAKVHLDEAMTTLSKIITFPPLRVTLPQIRDDIVNGETLYDSFKKHKIYPEVFLQMIRVGEKTASVDTMLDNLGKTTSEEGEAKIDQITSLLEPLIIVVLGIVVAVILISMYLPMFQLSNTIQ